MEKYNLTFLQTQPKKIKQGLRFVDTTEIDAITRQHFIGTITWEKIQCVSLKQATNNPTICNLI